MKRHTDCSGSVPQILTHTHTHTQARLHTGTWWDFLWVVDYQGLAGAEWKDKEVCVFRFPGIYTGIPISLHISSAIDVKWETKLPLRLISWFRNPGMQFLSLNCFNYLSEVVRNKIIYHLLYFSYIVQDHLW